MFELGYPWDRCNITPEDNFTNSKNYDPLYWNAGRKFTKGILSSGESFIEQWLATNNLINEVDIYSYVLEKGTFIKFRVIHGAKGTGIFNAVIILVCHKLGFENFYNINDALKSNTHL